MSLLQTPTLFLLEFCVPSSWGYCQKRSHLIGCGLHRRTDTPTESLTDRIYWRRDLPVIGFLALLTIQLGTHTSIRTE